MSQSTVVTCTGRAIEKQGGSNSASAARKLVQALVKNRSERGEIVRDTGSVRCGRSAVVQRIARAVLTRLGKAVRDEDSREVRIALAWQRIVGVRDTRQDVPARV